MGLCAVAAEREDAASRRAAAIVLIGVIGVPAMRAHCTSGEWFGKGMLKEHAGNG
jgi:hypothetical protein